MSSDTPGAEEPTFRKTPGWQIVEHVPLPPGRALPPPRPADAGQWAAGPDDDDDAPDDDDAWPPPPAPPPLNGGMTNQALAAQDAITGRPVPHRASFGPSTRPLFSELDQLLTRVAEQRHSQPLAAARAGGQWAASHDRRGSSETGRRARAGWLLLLALLMAAAVLTLLAYLALAAHLPPLAL